MTDTLPTFGLGDPGPMRDRLVDAVLAGRKTATSWLRVFYEMEGIPLPRVGDRFRLIDSAGTPLDVVETTGSEVLRLTDVGVDVAYAEGQNFTDRDEWRAVHVAYWDRFREEVRAFLRDDSWVIDDDTPIVVEFFRLVR